MAYKRIVFVMVLGGSLVASSVCLADNERPENTGMNVRDRSSNAVLPENQSNKGVYLDRSASIRKEIVDKKNLSTTSKNIKIITLDNGTVVLRGPVKSESEKREIEAIAQKHSGSNQVQSYLEISVG